MNDTHDNKISIAGAADADTAKKSKSVIDEWLTMRGDLESEGDILIKGKVIGNVNCKMLILDEDAVVEGGIIAEEVVIRGTTKGGVVQAKRVLLQSTARVLSEIKHERFAAEEGAHIEGALSRIDSIPTEKTKTAKTATKTAKKADNSNAEAGTGISSQNGTGEYTNGGAPHS